MRILLALICFLAPPALAESVKMSPLGPATAKAIRPVADAAERTFARMPQLRLTSNLGEICDGDNDSDPFTRYCTSLNTIFMASDLAERVPGSLAAYMVAHQYGHAVQVRHGVADMALSRIRAAPEREAEFRGWVTRQVECIAGVLIARSGGALPDMNIELFSSSHWGRAPMAHGPKVSIGVAERRLWVERGFRSNDFAACEVGEFSASKILAAEQ